MCLHAVDYYACGCKKSGPILERYCKTYYYDNHDNINLARGRRYPIRPCGLFDLIEYVVNGACRSHRRQADLERKKGALEKGKVALEREIVNEKRERERENGSDHGRHGRGGRGRRGARSPSWAPC